MSAILKREIKNYLKRPLYWIGILIVVLGVYQNLSPYLGIHYLEQGEAIENEYPDTVREGEVYEGYVPSSEEKQRTDWEKSIQDTLVAEFQMSQSEAEEVINGMEQMSIENACAYLEEEYSFYGAENVYVDSAYHKGTPEEINSYIKEKLQDHRFSWYFSRKFADFGGLYMGFFAAVMLSVLYMQDTRKNTYELLHTKPVSAFRYVAGKAAGGFAVCIIVLAILNVVFWALCLKSAAHGGFEVSVFDFVESTCLYILPNMLMIVSIYGLIALLFKNPLPALPLLILYMIYSNMGSRNAEGVYGYYGRPLAIMVRFPGQFFDVAPPPLALLNQCFLIIASVCILFISVKLWKRRRI